MKFIRKATMRGSIEDNTVERKTLFDGSFKRGWKITSFIIFPEDPTSGNSDCFGCLATEEAAATSDWNADDNRQIAWSSTNMAGGYAANGFFEVIDEENLIVEDLYIFGNDANDNDVNYRIEMEQYSFSDWRGALAMVRNNAQNVGN